MHRVARLRRSQGSLLFGHRNDGFSTLAHAFVTLFRAALGDFNFEELVEVNPKLAAAFFVFYQVGAHCGLCIARCAPTARSLHTRCTRVAHSRAVSVPCQGHLQH